jgi:dUTP pyrophosphatase
MLGTGLSIAVPEGWFGAIFARSGLATKQGLRPANCVGVCDSDYRGEYIIAIHNDSDAVRTVAPGDRIAQLVVLPFQGAEFEETEALPDTDRGAGGFGSTGV